MVAPLKTTGLDELNSLQRRFTRLLGLGRITKDDFDYCEERLREVEERIITMRERIPHRNPF